MNNKYIATYVEYMLTEDSYQDGEGETLSCWNEDLQGGDTVAEVLSHIPYNDMANDSLFDINVDGKEDIDMFDRYFPDEEPGRFDRDILVHVNTNGQIERMTEEQFNAWKEGKCRLYNLHIIVKINKIVDLTEDDFKNE